KVCVLVDLPYGKRAIGTKWAFRNKKDEIGIVARNKARLVAQGYTLEDGIDYKEVFAPVARIEAIRIFLAYASLMGFMVYQMDVNSKIDQTLFIKRQKGDILLVQIYVDDIIFGSINKDLCKSFEKLIKDKFQMSLMGELTFFLGLQVQQKKDGIFISQDKYVAEILRKFRLSDGRSDSTPIDTEKPLLKDPNDEDVDVYTYRLMIGSLMYLTSSIPDIMFAICACARFQVTPKASHQHAVEKFGIGVSVVDLQVFAVRICYCFWTTVAVKKVNDVIRLQTLVDKRKVVVTEAKNRDALRLDEAEGVEYIPNEEFFVELARMGYEKPSTKHEAIHQTYVLQSILLKPVEVSYTHHLTVYEYQKNFMECVYFIKGICYHISIFRKQVGDLSTHTTKYTSPALTQKVFANMRRVEIYKIDLDHANKVLSMQEDKTEPAKVQEVVDVVTTAKIITEDEAIDHVKKKAKEDPAVKIYQVLKRKPQTEAQARKNMMVYLKNVVGFKMDYFKGMSYDDIRLIFEAKFNTNVAFLQKTKEHIEEEESRALKRLNETPAERAAKRKKLDEERLNETPAERAAKMQKLDEEVEELKRHLQIVPNEDDGVYTEATPLARKVPVVNYQIIELNNKPYYKIIRADDTHHLYVTFLSLLRKFDREDLEAL
nr:retrotransposon protein, putative, unclassified [Tanacetum cinerariifolium]